MEKKPSILSSSIAVITIAIIFDGPHFIKYPLLIMGIVLLIRGIQEYEQQKKAANRPSNNNSIKE